MSDGRLRVVAVMTHPVQYLSPWFRHIHAHAPELHFSVVYATEPTRRQQGVGFGRAFEWDVPLRAGYDSHVIRPASEDGSLDSGEFWGIDVPGIGEAVRALDPDVVLVAGWHSITQVRAIVAMRRAGVPLLYRGDTHLGSGSARWPRLSRARARLLLRQFSGYLAVGARSREYLRAMGAPDPAIVSSPHAIDNDWFAARAAAARGLRAEMRAAYGFVEAQRVVLYAGKLTANKRPADVIDAAAALENGAALFVGDGSERASLEAHARSRGVTAVFTGFLNQAQIADAYVAADALLIPGKETWGLVANEALACGLPVVVSTDVGAATDLSADGVCVSVPPGDHHVAAQALATLIDHRRSGAGSAADCQAVVGRLSFAAATQGLVTAATFAAAARRRAVEAPARVVALCGNLVFAGGMERITFEALAGVTRGGADVHALVNKWSSRPIAELAERAGASWEVGHYDARLDGVLRHPIRMMRALVDMARASGQLCRLLASRRVTHVFAVDFRAVLLHAPALVGCRLLGVPVLLRSGVAPTNTRLHTLLWRGVIGPLVTRHIANSAFTARELAAAGVPASRIVTIANVAPKRHGADGSLVRDRGLIAYVGQVIPEKGVLPLMDAAGLLVARGHDVRLAVTGQMDGWAPEAVHGYRAAVRARATAPDLAGRVSFLGWREDVAEVLQRASVHCCPSQPEQREGFGITVVEAKRAGAPSVVCPSGALPELIEHQRDGWIARGFDAVAIAEGLEWLLADENRLAEMQHAARASSRLYDPAVFERRWREMFGLRASHPEVRDGAGVLVDARGASR